MRHCDPTLGIEAFEISNQQQPEVGLWRQTRAADRCVERRTLRFDERVKRVPVEHLIQSLIERMPALCDGQLVCRNPQPWCACPVLASSHGHAGV